MAEERLNDQLTPQVEENEESALNKFKNFPVWKILYKNLLLIIICTIIFGGIGAVYGFLTTKPKYTAAGSVLLSISLDSTVEETNSATDISLSKLYLPTITEIIASPAVVKEANKVYMGSGSIDLGSIGITYRDNSLLFTMSYTDLDPKVAESKLTTIIAAAEEVLRTSGSTYVPAKEFTLTRTQKEFRITRFHDGVKYVVAGLVIGLVGSVAYAFLYYILDNKVKSAAEIEELTGVSVIAYIDKTK